MKVYGADDSELGDVPLSETQMAALQAGAIAVLYHTPQLLHAELGRRSGSFQLHIDGERLRTTTPDALNDFLQLQAAVAAIRTTRGI